MAFSIFLVREIINYVYSIKDTIELKIKTTQFKIDEEDIDNNPFKRKYRKLNTCKSEFINEPDDIHIDNPFHRKEKRIKTFG